MQSQGPEEVLDGTNAQRYHPYHDYVSGSLVAAIPPPERPIPQIIRRPVPSSHQRAPQHVQIGANPSHSFCDYCNNSSIPPISTPPARDQHPPYPMESECAEASDALKDPDDQDRPDPYQSEEHHLVGATDYATATATATATTTAVDTDTEMAGRTSNSAPDHVLSARYRAPDPDPDPSPPPTHRSNRVRVCARARATATAAAAAAAAAAATASHLNHLNHLAQRLKGLASRLKQWPGAQAQAQVQVQAQTRTKAKTEIRRTEAGRTRLSVSTSTSASVAEAEGGGRGEVGCGLGPVGGAPRSPYYMDAPRGRLGVVNWV